MNRLLNMLSAAAVATGAAGAVSPALAAAPTAARQCFSPSQVTAMQPVGDRQVNIRVGARDVFRVDLAQPCHQLRQPQRVLTVRPLASGVSICSGADFVLGAEVNGFTEQCAVSSITRLTPDQVAALPNRERP